MRLSKTVAILALGSLVTMSFAAEGLKWLTSYSEAVKLSKKTNKPILADFTGSDWCTWCIRLHKEVFDKPEFAEWAKKNVVLLELDYPQSKPQPAALKKQNAELQQKYQIQGYPTVLFLDHTGKMLGQYGYDQGGPAVWTKKASEMIKRK